MQQVRADIANALESVSIGGVPIFDVWLCERVGAAGDDETSRGICLKQAKRADIVLVLYNGHAGYEHEGRGICHEEWVAARHVNPKKTRVIWLESLATKAWMQAAEADPATADGQFWAALDAADPFAPRAATPEEATVKAVEAAGLALRELAISPLPAGRASTVSRSSGIAWERLRPAARAAEMLAAARVVLGDSPTTSIEGGWILRPLDGSTVAVRPHVVPGSLADADARALLGHPVDDQDEHLDAFRAATAAGPLEVVFVQRGATEAQVRRLFVPDASVAGSSFGFYVWSEASGAQVLVLKNCVDPDVLRAAWTDAMEWMAKEGVAGRAAELAAERVELLALLRKRRRAGRAPRP